MSADCRSVCLTRLSGFTAGTRIPIRIHIHIHIQIVGHSNKSHGPKLNLCVHYVCQLPASSLSLSLSVSLSLFLSTSLALASIYRLL